MPRNIFPVFRVPDEVTSHLSVEIFSLFKRYFTLFPSYAPLYVVNNNQLVMMTMTMMIITTMMMTMMMMIIMIMMTIIMMTMMIIMMMTMIMMTMMIIMMTTTTMMMIMIMTMMIMMTMMMMMTMTIIMTTTMIMMTMMIISLISYFPFMVQLSMDLVYTCHSFPLHPSLVLSTIPRQQMTNQQVLHFLRHFFLRNNQLLANHKSAFDRSFSETKTLLLFADLIGILKPRWNDSHI